MKLLTSTWPCKSSRFVSNHPTAHAWREHCSLACARSKHRCRPFAENRTEPQPYATFQRVAQPYRQTGLTIWHLLTAVAYAGRFHMFEKVFVCNGWTAACFFTENQPLLSLLGRIQPTLFKFTSAPKDFIKPHTLDKTLHTPKHFNYTQG